MRNFIEKKLQYAINRFLMLDPESKNKILALNGKVISIRFSGTPLKIQFVFENTQIKINTSEILTPDTLIVGTPFTLAHLSLSKNRKPFFEEDVVLSGDVECGQQVLDLFDSLEIDWEEYLSYLIGDVGAHSIGHLARQFISFRKHAEKSILDNVNEYLHEEIELVPEPAALEDFFQKIDSLRMDTDRLEKQIEAFENKVLKGEPC